MIQKRQLAPNQWPWGEVVNLYEQMCNLGGVVEYHSSSSPPLLSQALLRAGKPIPVGWKEFLKKVSHTNCINPQPQRNSYSATATVQQLQRHSATATAAQRRNTATPQRRNATMLQHYMFMNGTSMGKAMNACIINYALLGVWTAT